MKNIGFVYAILAAVTWGLVYAIDQKILDRVSPVSYLLVGYILSLIMILPFALFDLDGVKTLLSSGRNNLLLIVLATGLALLASFFIFSSIKLLDASTASIFEIAYPFFVVLFSVLLYGQVINGYFALGAALLFAGAVVIIKLA